MTDIDLAALQHDETVAWLSTHGWSRASIGRAGQMWENPQLDAKVGVVDNLGSDPDSHAGLLWRIARAHNRSPEDIAEEISTWHIDTTLLRAASDDLLAGTIPLNAAAAMLESARLMFRSAATSSVRIKAHIGGNYSRLGDDIAESIRMGHTRKGSYVVPILVRVGDSEPADAGQEPITGWDAVARSVESPQRRATRTFAQALAAVHETIIQPARAPVGARLEEVVTRGVSREFITAITHTLDQPAVGTLDARFRWAGAQPPPPVPDEITIPADAKPLLAETSRRLKTAKPPSYEVFTGPVVLIAREPDEKVTRLAIRTMYRGRPSRVESTTRASPAAVAEWMDQRSIVQIRGRLSRTTTGLVVIGGEVAVFDELSHATDPDDIADHLWRHELTEAEATAIEPPAPRGDEAQA